MSPKRAGLMALLEAYKLQHRDATNIPDDEQLLNYIRQKIQNPTENNALSASLDELPGAITLKLSVLIALLGKAFEADTLKNKLVFIEALLTAHSNSLHEARRIMKDPREGTSAQRQSKALKHLGLLHDPDGKGRVNPNYQAAAGYYVLLRRGGQFFIDDILTTQEKLTHEEAVSKICSRFHLEWESLERAWKRLQIQVSYNASIYDDTNDD